MKGLFIPGIDAEMFRNGCLESIEALMAEGEIYDVDYPLEQKQKTGHWITENMSDGDVAYRCSECNELFWLECGTPKDNKYNFCPECGERLIEPQNLKYADNDTMMPAT